MRHLQRHLRRIHRLIKQKIRNVVPIILVIAVGIIIIHLIIGLKIPFPIPGSQGSSLLLPPDLPPFISVGEKVLTSFEGQLSKKTEATEYFSKGEYDEAIKLLKLARKYVNINDPEALIYLNNAEIEKSKQEYYTIAVVAPLNDSNLNTQKNTGLEIIRGVAQAQEVVNHPEEYDDGLGNDIKGIRLKIAIADDGNNSERAERIAKDMKKYPDIKAVIGHFSSGVTKAVAPIYKKNQLVLISPTSTAVNISPSREYVFRTVPTNDEIASSLADYLQEREEKKAAVVYNDGSPYSRDLKEGFRDKFSGKSESDFIFGNASEEKEVLDNLVDKVLNLVNNEAAALALLPDSNNRQAAIEIINAIRSNGNNNFTIVGGDSLYNKAVLDSNNQTSDLVLTVPWYSECYNANNPKFENISERLWGTSSLSWRTAFAYDATLVLIKALKQKPATRQELREILVGDNPKFKVEGITGKISFNDSGDRNGAKIQLVKVVQKSDGKLGFEPEPSCN